jgi:hypothetical protein
MELSELRYPEMRRELVSYIKSLADKQYQQGVWLNGDLHPDIVHDELDYAIHFLYDDTILAKDPYALIGWILLSKEEAEAITRLIENLDLLFDKYGTELEDRDYLRKNEWLDVLQAAKSAETILKEG